MCGRRKGRRRSISRGRKDRRKKGHACIYTSRTTYNNIARPSAAAHATTLPPPPRSSLGRSRLRVNRRYIYTLYPHAILYQRHRKVSSRAHTDRWLINYLVDHRDALATVASRYTYHCATKSHGGAHAQLIRGVGAQAHGVCRTTIHTSRHVRTGHVIYGRWICMRARNATR